MAGKPPARLVGSHRCWNRRCAKEAPVKETSSGKLHASCDWCGLSHYAEPGTLEYAHLKADTTPIADEAPADPPPPEPAPEPTAKPKARASWASPINPGA